MTAWNPALYRGWFVVASSRQLRHLRRKPLGITLLDRRIVLARLRSGELLALDDCCPHRHVPLSVGHVSELGLQCGYHGWTFGADGQCTALPGLPAGSCKPAVRVGTWQAVERDGLIWIRATPATEPASQAPTSFSSPGAPWPHAWPEFMRKLPADGHRFLWQATWQGRAVDALENFLDPLHTHFVHPGLVRRDGERCSVHAALTRTNGALQIDYSGQPQQNGLLYRLFESRRTHERAHFDTAAPGSAQLEYRYENGSALYFTLHFSPQSERSLRVHGTLHVENRWAPPWAVRTFAWPFLRRVARQDQAIVEAQADNSAHFSRTAGISTELDLVRPSLDAIWSPNAQPLADETRQINILL